LGARYGNVDSNPRRSKAVGSSTHGGGKRNTAGRWE